jgi:hypothetical protein
MLVKAGLAGQLTRCFMFAFRLSCSGKGIHRVYASQAQEAFLEGHVTAFEVTGGIPPGPAVCEPAVSNPAASF